MGKICSFFSAGVFYVSLIAGLFLGVMPKSAQAGCFWISGTNFDIGSSVNTTDITLELATYKMMNFRFWSNDARFPVGSLMARDTVKLTSSVCTGLGELKGSQVDFVYEPPVGAVPHEGGFKIPSTADGVAMVVHLLVGTPHAGGVFFGTSSGTVTSGGILTGSVLPALPVQLTLLKTGPFTAEPSSAPSVIDFPEGLGRVKYYSTSNPTVVAMADNRLKMSRTLTPSSNAGITATAHAPTCSARKIGTVDLEGVNAGKSNIILAPVSASDFTGIGALEKAANTLQLLFGCEGTITTKASISFDATHPYSSGADGVGMPKPGADVGVQVLFNHVPIKFGVRSDSLAWNAKTYEANGVSNSDMRFGKLSPQGLYCIKDCGADMSNGNWVDGGVASGTNLGIDTPLTFKYYQTTSKRPAPQKFTVPFTITLTVN